MARGGRLAPACLPAPKRPVALLLPGRPHAACLRHLCPRQCQRPAQRRHPRRHLASSQPAWHRPLQRRRSYLSARPAPHCCHITLVSSAVDTNRIAVLQISPMTFMHSRGICSGSVPAHPGPLQLSDGQRRRLRCARQAKSAECGASQAIRAHIDGRRSRRAPAIMKEAPWHPVACSTRTETSHSNPVLVCINGCCLWHTTASGSGCHQTAPSHCHGRHAEVSDNCTSASQATRLRITASLRCCVQQPWRTVLQGQCSPLVTAVNLSTFFSTPQSGQREVPPLAPGLCFLRHGCCRGPLPLAERCQI